MVAMVCSSNAPSPPRRLPGAGERGWVAFNRPELVGRRLPQRCSGFGFLL
jgi:hypothetical protein